MTVEILDAIARRATATPARAAHVWRDQTMTYGELAARSDALAAELRARLPRGTPVVVYGHKQPGLLAAFLACMKAGHPYVPVDAGLPAARVAKVAEHARAALILAPGAPAPVDGVPQLAGEDFAAIASRRAAAPGDALRADEVVYIMYTSGSTGAPKGVQITLANLAGFVAWATDAHPVAGGRRFLNQAPFSFDLSVMDLYLSLTTGGTLHSIDREAIENPLDLRAQLAAADVNVWVSTPSFAEMCLGDRRFDAAHLPSLACFLFCGETLTPSCVRRLHARFPAARVYNLYGPTEATVAVTSILVDDALLARSEPGSLPLGTPRPDTRLLVVDGDGREVPPGEAGEIVIAGPSVGRGYLHAPELTERAFAGDRYRTGDSGRYDGDALMFGGRLDNQIKLFGHRIELDDVAHNLAALPGVAHAVVLPVERAGRCEALAAFVVVTEAGPEATPSSLRAELARRVPKYMVPRDIVCRGALPMTVNGKIDRARLIAELG